MRVYIHIGKSDRKISALTRRVYGVAINPQHSGGNSLKGNSILRNLRNKRIKGTKLLSLKNTIQCIETNERRWIKGPDLNVTTLLTSNNIITQGLTIKTLLKLFVLGKMCSKQASHTWCYKTTSTTAGSVFYFRNLLHKAAFRWVSSFSIYFTSPHVSISVSK